MDQKVVAENQSRHTVDDKVRERNHTALILEHKNGLRVPVRREDVCHIQIESPAKGARQRGAIGLGIAANGHRIREGTHLPQPR